MSFGLVDSINDNAYIALFGIEGIKFSDELMPVVQFQYHLLAALHAHFGGDSA